MPGVRSEPLDRLPGSSTDDPFLRVAAGWLVGHPANTATAYRRDLGRPSGGRFTNNDRFRYRSCWSLLARAGSAELGPEVSALGESSLKLNQVYSRPIAAARA